MKSNSTKQPIKNIVELQNHIKFKKQLLKEESDKLKHKYSSVKKIDFDTEIETLKFHILRINARIDEIQTMLENTNFSVLVVATLLQDNKLVTEKNIQAAAVKVNKMKQQEQEKLEKFRIDSFKEILTDTNIKAADA
jgi:methyl-accepting chemotaxis protein